MSLSIRARLTLWYCAVVVVVLVTGAVAGSFTQQELSLQRLDDDLARSMATLEGVMRTEFGEGLTLEHAAEEASIEVVVPDRIMMLARRDGTLLEVWGLPAVRTSLPSLAAREGIATVTTSAGAVRMMTRQVRHRDHQYIGAVIAPLAAFHAQHAEMVRAMWVGGIIALVAAAAGGWLIGRQTLKPLAQMARDADRVDASDPKERLVLPSAQDELGRLAVSFNALLDRLEGSLNVQRQFMADASHELRTPVSIVRTTAQVTLAQRTRSSDEYRESLTIIGEQANRLARLVEAMFLLTRAEARGVPLQREFLNLDDVLDECVRAARVVADQRAVTVLVTGGAEEVALIGDDMLLRQMIGNLLDNAIRHAASTVTAGLVRSPEHLRRPEGLRPPAVSLECIQLRVTDDGPGIGPPDRERIFDRFVRLGASGGAGLGLPIARWIAGAHGGTVTLERAEAGQTIFVVTLPLDRSGTGAPISALSPTLSPAGQISDTTPAR